MACTTSRPIIKNKIESIAQYTKCQPTSTQQLLHLVNWPPLSSQPLYYIRCVQDHSNLHALVPPLRSLWLHHQSSISWYLYHLDLNRIHYEALPIKSLRALDQQQQITFQWKNDTNTKKRVPPKQLALHTGIVLIIALRF